MCPGGTECGMAAPRVFICYRRDDSAGHAGRLFDRLSTRLGAERVFRDVDTLAAGEDFQQAVQRRLAESDLLLALIGTRWLQAADAQGRPRLVDPADPVRVEIATALQQGLRVVPVLLPGAALPAAEQLPDDLAALPRHQAVDLRDASFDRDVDLLLERIAPGRRRRRRWLVAVAAVLLLAGSAAALWQRSQSPEQARARLAEQGLAFDADTLVARAGAGDLHAVTLLLRAGLPVDAPDRRQVTALQRAVAEGQMPVVQALLAQGADAGAALPWAAGHGRPDMLALLLARQPDPTARGRALHNAAGGPHTDIVRTLLEAGADPNARGGRYQSTPLIEAAAEPNAATVQLLLQRGADPALKSEFGDTPLLAVLRPRGSSPGADEASQRLQTLRLLLDHGVALEDRLQSMQEWQPTALLLAIDNGLPEAALLLIQRGADVEARTGFTGNEQPDMNALMWAAYEGQAEVVSALLDKGARIDLQNGSGHTALMIAAEAGREEALQRLVMRGANPALRNRDGQTALDLARAAGHDALVRQLASLTPPARP